MTTYVKTQEIVEAIQFNGSNEKDVARFIEEGLTCTALIAHSSNRLALLEEGSSYVTWVDPQDWVVRKFGLIILSDSKFAGRYTPITRETA